jgi:hypothetical protein
MLVRGRREPRREGDCSGNFGRLVWRMAVLSRVQMETICVSHDIIAERRAPRGDSLTIPLYRGRGDEANRTNLLPVYWDTRPRQRHFITSCSPARPAYLDGTNGSSKAG